MRNYTDLRVWQEAHALTLDIYEQTSEFPETQKYGLTDQLRRSSRSIGANLAEGCGRMSDKDFRRFVNIAVGSANELEYDILICRDVGYITSEKHEEWRDKVVGLRRGLWALQKSLG